MGRGDPAGRVLHAFLVARRAATVTGLLTAIVGWVAAADVNVRYVWREAAVPASLEITQVYGYLMCPQTARVLVQDDDGVFNLPGGTPEPLTRICLRRWRGRRLRRARSVSMTLSISGSRRCIAATVHRMRRCGWWAGSLGLTGVGQTLMVGGSTVA